MFNDAFTYMSNMIKRRHGRPIPSSHLHVFQHEGEMELGGGYWKVIYVPGHSVKSKLFFQ